MNFGRAIQNLARAISAFADVPQGWLSIALFLLICVGDSAGARYSRYVMLRPRNPIGALHIHSQNSFYDILAPLVNCIEPISLIYHSMQNFSIIVIFPDLNGGCATLDIHQGCVLCFSHSHCTTRRTLKIFRLR